FRDAISGTIPPYFSCAATCDATSLASNSWPERSSRKIATAVSSQEVSNASTVFMCVEAAVSTAGERRSPRRAPLQLFLYRFRLRRALLCVDHHAFECINCAQHLGIFCLDDADLVLWLGISRVAQRIEGALLFGSHADPNIWGHTIPLNDLSAGSVVLRRGKTDRGSVWQLQNILDGTFSESGFTNQNRATQILERACNNLSAARAAFVNQQDHRKVRTRLTYRGGRVIMLLRSNPALRRNDLCVGWQKLSAHIDRAVQ